jgi:hypothetical protein
LGDDIAPASLSFWWGGKSESNTSDNNQPLLFHSTSTIPKSFFYTKHFPKTTPHNTAIMPRQFFVGGNFKMYAANAPQQPQ